MSYLYSACSINMMLNNIDSIIDEVGLDDEFKKISELNTFKLVMKGLPKIYSFIKNIVAIVELTESKLLSKIYKASSDEKLRVACELIDRYIRLPWYLDLIDKPIIRMVISIIVRSFNKMYGKKWNNFSVIVV